MSKILLKPKAQRKLSDIIEKLEFAIGDHVTDTKTFSALVKKTSELGRLIAEAEMDAKSVDELPFVITARTYHANWDKAMNNDDPAFNNLRLPTISEMRQIVECHDHPLCKNDYWVFDDVAVVEAFVFRVKKKSHEIVSDAKCEPHTYFYIKNK
jgi:hypothetical protein